MAEVFRILDATNRKTPPDPMQMVMGQNQTGKLPTNCILIRRDGFEIAIEDSIAPIHDRDGQATGAVIVFHDVSTVRAMAVQMTHAAQHDFLTGLPNRMLLNDRVNQAIALAARHAKKVVVLFLDLDGFKHINDSLGHPIGDTLLQSIAKRLVACVRHSDTVSRQGGDEFVVLLSEVEHSEDAAIMARKILKAVAEVHAVGLHDLHATTSIGLSVYPDDGLDAETLIKNADTAIVGRESRAKSRGGVPLNQNYVGLNAMTHIFYRIDHTAGEQAQRLVWTHDAQIEVRLDLKVIERGVMLTRMDHNHFEFSRSVTQIADH